MRRTLYMVIVLFCLTALFPIPGQVLAAPLKFSGPGKGAYKPTIQKLYSPADYDLVRKWHKDITGKELSADAYNDAIGALEEGARDLEELRRDFVNGEEARKRLSALERLFWGFLARPPTKDESESVDAMLRDIKGDIDKQIEEVVNNLEKNPQGFCCSDLNRDLKICRSVEDVRKAILWSDEFLNLRLKELYRVYLKREADGGGLDSLRRAFRDRPSRETVPEFFRRARMELLSSEEGKRVHPKLVERLFLVFLRRFPTSEELGKYGSKNEKDLSAELDCLEDAIKIRVEEVYRWVFGREADGEGLKFWGNKVRQQLMIQYSMPNFGNTSRDYRTFPCPIAQLVKDFAQTPPDVITGIAVAQMTLVEDLRSRMEIEDIEKSLPEESGKETEDQIMLRNLFEEYVLRLPTDAEVEKLLEEANESKKSSGGSFPFRKGKKPPASTPPSPAPNREAQLKALVVKSGSFTAEAARRAKAFGELYMDLFRKEPPAQEATRRIKELNAGLVSIKGLAKEYQTTEPYKGQFETVLRELATGKLPPFPELPLSPAQKKFVESLGTQLKGLNIDFATLFRDLLMREPTDEEQATFVAAINKAVGDLGIALLPTGPLTPKSIETFRKSQMDKLKNLPRVAKELAEKLKKELLASPEFKELAERREIYLTELYQNILGRSPDAGGLKFYLDKLSKGDITIPGIQAEMMKSPEYQKYQLASQNYSKNKPLKDEPKNESESTNTENVKTLKDIKGFENLDFADQVSVKDCTKKEEGGYVEYSGKASFFGLKDKDFFAVNTKDVYGVKSWLAGIVFEGTWTPEEYFSGPIDETVRDALKVVRLNGGALILSAANTTLDSKQMPESFHKFLDPVYQTTKTDDFKLRVNFGVNLLGRLNLDHDPVKKLMDLVKCKQKELLIHGSFPKNPKQYVMRVYFQRFNAPDWLPDNVKTIQPMIESNFKGVAMGVTIQTQFDGQSKPMDFSGRIDIPLRSQESCKLTGSLVGTWENALGLKGFDLSNITVIFRPEARIIALKATAQFGTRVVSVAAQPPISPGAFAIKGSINELNLDDLVLLAQKMGVDVRHEDLPLPQLSLRDILIMVSGVDDPNLGVFKGYMYDGKLLFNKEEFAKIHARQFTYGIEMEGESKPIDIGPLKVNGGTPDKGPMVDTELKPGAAHIKMAALIDIFGASRETQIFITREKILIEYINKLFDAYESHFKIEGKPDFKKPAFGIEAYMKADFINAALEQVDRATKDKIPDIVKKYIRNSFDVNEAGFRGSLDDCLDGEVPHFWVKFKCLGRNYTLDTAFNLKDSRKAIEKLGGEVGKEVLAKLDEFAKKLEEKVKAAVQKVKDAVVAALKKAVDTVKSWFKKKKDSSSGPSQRPVDARFIGYPVFYW